MYKNNYTGMVQEFRGVTRKRGPRPQGCSAQVRKILHIDLIVNLKIIKYNM